MRPLFAVPIAVVFAVLFVAALLISRVVNTAGDPQEVAGVINDADLYDFAYDRVLDAALADVTTRGLTLQTSSGGEETISFEDEARAHAALKAFIETVLPREYVRAKVEEALNGVIPYASGRTDGFEVDLETSERIEAVPEAVRIAAARIGLGELVVSELLVPTVRDISSSITDEALGIALTQEEAEAATRLILPPEWVEEQVFAVVDQSAPYFAGTDDELNVVIRFTDRIPVAGEVLKAKLNDEDTLSNLVFAQVVDPLVASLVDDNTTFTFGIQITEADIQEAVEIVAPPDWVAEQGDGIIDALIAWLTGDADTLTYTLDLAERKAEAAVEMEALALRKLDEQVAATPVCTGPLDAAASLNTTLAGGFPSCLPSDSSEVLSIMEPVIRNEIRNYMLTSLPDQVTYSDAALRAHLGPDALDSLDALREQVINGVGFTERDLVNLLAPSGDPVAVANAYETLDVVRAGVVFDETTITDRLAPQQLSQFDQVREWINLGWTFRWVIFLPAIISLVLVAFIGGKGWAGRAKWAGAPVAAVAILFFVSIQVGWASTASLRQFGASPDTLSAETREAYPALASLIYGGEFQNMLERVGSAWMTSLAMSAVPWAVAGLALLAVGILYPRYRAMLPESLGGPAAPPTPERTTSRPIPDTRDAQVQRSMDDHDYLMGEDESSSSEPEEAA